MLQFFRIDIDVARRLGLEGAELLVYSALSYLCKKGAYSGTYSELSELSCCGGRMTASRIVKRLLDRGLLIQTEAGIMLGDAQNERCDAQNERCDAQNEQKMLKMSANTKKKNQKEIYKEKEVVVFTRDTRDETTTEPPPPFFEEWWKRYGIGDYYHEQKEQCRAYVSGLGEADRVQLMNHTAEYVKKRAEDRRKQPIFYLRDGVWKNAVESAKPRFYAGAEIDRLWEMGKKVVVVENTQYEGVVRYPTTTREEAERFGLKIVRNLDPLPP